MVVLSIVARATKNRVETRGFVYAKTANEAGFCVKKIERFGDDYLLSRLRHYHWP